MDDLPDKSIVVSEVNTNIVANKPAENQIKDLEERSFNFHDLISAFKNIEKRSSDSEFAYDTLKRFKSDDEKYQVNPMLKEKMKIENEIFPKISENIFFKKRFDNHDF